ncbi:serine protease gd [Orussus abietinus]|uniref:serine protease gd n=1 Tax=Orussus abietinus TaxID=222816 RepID=UPI000626D40E|nr:serine protease gd [Orussus abietinus]
MGSLTAHRIRTTRRTLRNDQFLISTSLCQSPCPNFFRYLRDDKTREMVGRVEIPAAPRGVPLHLRVSLSIPTVLPTKYVGRLQLEQTKEEAIGMVNKGKPLVYIIHFPLRQPIPLITRILFNRRQYCIGPRAMGPFVTSIVLEHTLFPPEVIHLSEGPLKPGSWGDYFGGHPEAVNTEVETTSLEPLPSRVESLPSSLEPKPMPMEPSSMPNSMLKPEPGAMLNPRPQLETSPFFYPEIDETCGRPRSDNVNLLIAKGERTRPGQWPWLVGIFFVKLKFEFQCAGSLISNRHVLTAAHCFKLPENEDVPVSSLLVSIGRHRLDDWKESDSVSVEVEDLRMHPEYGHRFSGSSDIAVLVLRENVTFGRTIQPVCLWSGSRNLDNVVGEFGYVVGWGRDEEGHANVAEPRMIKVPIVSQEDCLRSNPDFVSATSDRTFCAGMRDGSGPCNGDSGSGLVLRNDLTGAFYLRGIVSLSLLDKKTMSCDLSQYIVYTDVAKYLDWIRKEIET